MRDRFGRHHAPNGQYVTGAEVRGDDDPFDAIRHIVVDEPRLGLRERITEPIRADDRLRVPIATQPTVSDKDARLFRERHDAAQPTPERRLRVCPACHGRGRSGAIAETRCGRCWGTGAVPRYVHPILARED